MKKYSGLVKERLEAATASDIKVTEGKYQERLAEFLKGLGVSNLSELSKDDQLKVLESVNEAEKKDTSNDDGESKDGDSNDGDGKVETEAEFRSFAKEFLKEAHGEDYDESKSKKMIDDLVAKYGGDNKWADAVGVVQNS